MYNVGLIRLAQMAPMCTTPI